MTLHPRQAELVNAGKHNFVRTEGGRIVEMSIWLPQVLAAGLNGSKGHLRAHFHAKAKHRKEYRTALTSVGAELALSLNVPWVLLPWELHEEERWAFSETLPIAYPLLCRYTRVVTRSRRMDFDNAGSTLKHIWDAMVDCGFLVDDGPDYISGLDLREHIVPKRTHQGSLLYFAVPGLTD